MGAYGATKDEAKENAWERDRRMDSGYSIDRAIFDGGPMPGHKPAEPMGILALVSAFRIEFRDEFFLWWTKQPEPRDHAEVAMIRWEVSRFGDQLFFCAHSLLWFEIRRRLIGKADPVPRRARLTPGLTDEQRRDRMLVAASQLADKMAMPEFASEGEGAEIVE